MKKKHLFLYLKTGGGHLAPARSIANYIRVKHKNEVIPVIADGFLGVNRVIRYFIEDGYRFSQSKALWIFESLYALNKIKWIGSIIIAFLAFCIRPQLEKQILAGTPSKIIIFHFFLIKPVLRILRKNNLKTPVTVVVTDPFTAHPFWFLEKTPKFIVFSENLKQHFIKKGIQPENISVFPFILDEKFTRPLNPILSQSIKKNLGFDINKKLVLILGGGDGIPKGKKILKNLIKYSPGLQIAIICGNNHSLYKKAWKLKSKHNYHDLKVFGYVDFVYELINIADVVVTKCGASTFMEILMSGKIPVISSYVWEQEKGNMEFVRDNHLGLYENKATLLPERVNEIIHNPHIAEVYKSNIQIMSLKNGTPLVSDFITSE